jgi:uncharacterized protein (TIGR00297 family)
MSVLTRGGTVAAAVVGAAALAAGWKWALVLIVYFLTCTILTRWRREVKGARTSGIVDKGGARDARQVLANGGVFCMAALACVVDRSSSNAAWIALGAGALAASAADTWATEIGIAVGSRPRSILTGRAVTPGTSGGITLAGSLGAACGAGLVAALTLALGWPPTIALCIFAGGVTGAFGDSLIGATLQERRHCPACDLATEQRTHRCGSPTHHLSGLAGFDNDAVNLVTSAAGGLLAMALVR